MRKLLAVLLAAIMLVGAFAILPVGAATPTLTSSFDGTTSAEDDVPDLLITEVLLNSKSGDGDLDDQLQGDSSTLISPDAFDYIEIYNRGPEPVCLYDYAIIAGDGKAFSNRNNSQVGRFGNKKVELAANELRQNPSAKGKLDAKLASTDSFVNPIDEQDVMLNPGEFAVIWFYGTGTSELTKKKAAPVGKAEFCSHYKMPEDTLLIAVPAIEGVESLFELKSNYMFALVEDDFDPSTVSAVSNAYGTGASLDDRIICMADYTIATAVGIMTEVGMDNAAAYYVPANCTPEVLNKVAETVNGQNAKVYSTYVEADYIPSYAATAVISFTQEPSPGTMPAWQWAYVDPVGDTTTQFGVTYRHGLKELSAAAEGANYDAKMKALVTDWEGNTKIKKDNKLDVTVTGGKVAWSTKAVDTFVTENAQVGAIEGGASENKINYKDFFVKREELERRHGNKKKATTTKKDGLPIWALILIIVGGVVLLGGIAVVVIIIIKKKNKPVAADDVAAEGEIEIVDETATTEAPVDEEVVIDAPSDESNE